MIYPSKHISHRVSLHPFQNRGPFYHDYWQVKSARSGNFCIRTRATRILRYQKIYSVLLHQIKIIFSGKRTPRNDNMTAGKRWCNDRWINKSKQVKMLVVWHKILQLNSPNSKHDAARGSIQCANSALNVRNMSPIITRTSDPRRTRQSHQGHMRLCTGNHGVSTHLRSKGMGCVNYMRDICCLHKMNKPRNSAKSTNPLRQRLTLNTIYPASKANNAIVTNCCRSLGKNCSLSGTTKNKEVWLHV